MKKVVLGIVVLILVFSSFGCSNPASDPVAISFYGEFGRISTTDFNEVLASIPSKQSYTFEEISSYRWLFRAKTQYDFSSSPGGTRDDIYNMLTTRGFSPNEANNAIDSIINTGNGMLFFNYAYSESFKIWMYIELE